MNIKQALDQVKTIQFSASALPVVKTCAREIQKKYPSISLVETESSIVSSGNNTLTISVEDELSFSDFDLNKVSEENYIYFQLNNEGSGKIVASKKYYLFAFVSLLLEDWAEKDVDAYKNGKVIPPAFTWQRVSYDYFIAQEGRIQRKLDRELYIRELARMGFTHIEVNGMATPMGFEPGPKGEILNMFFTYCAALDQFVYSKLNKGLYPTYILSANMRNLKHNTDLATKYGLVPGFTSFEPRCVPEEFFNRYPMLRGARVDHPFRSLKPRYNMTTTHPKVLEHYAEMVSKLVQEIPELGFITVWSNDSGAGFEHTKSLYVGRNGGAYMIREWKSDEEIGRLAGENVIRFLRNLQVAGSKVNPDFKVLTRMESFYGEHDTVWNGFGDGLEVETASLVAKGWAMPYKHPKYEDNDSINAGTIYQLDFDEREKQHIKDLQNRNANAHYYLTVGPHICFNPLLGVPYPSLTFKRISLLKENGVSHLAHQGGTQPPNLVPFNINHEITKLYQYNPDMDIDTEINRIAVKWAGEKYAKDLIKAWRETEEALLSFPNLIGLYVCYGFAWYRMWVRPFVPNMEAVSDEDRAFYEDFICTVPHNPNNVDISRDVLFQLTTAEKSKVVLQRIDTNLWTPMQKAIDILEAVVDNATKDLGENNVIYDQLIRLKALKCWMMTQRNIAAWITGVHGYMQAKTDSEKKENRELVKEMIEKEIANTKELKELWTSSGIEFMSVTDKGENQLVYGDNMGDLFDKRIAVMKKHINDEPFIDPNYMERKAGELLG